MSDRTSLTLDVSSSNHVNIDFAPPYSKDISPSADDASAALRPELLISISPFRDRVNPKSLTTVVGIGVGDGVGVGSGAVSYTHLTLPTIYTV